MARLLRIEETSGERDARKQKETAQRIRALVVVAVIAVIARVAIKDPAPKGGRDDHNGAPVKIMAGMLEAMPASERAKLSPQMIAQMMQADEDARIAKARLHSGQAPVAVAKGPYHPEAVPADSDPLGEKAKQQQYAYAKRQKAVDVVKDQMKAEANADKKAFVSFANGGSIRVQRVFRSPGGITLRLAGVAATYPSSMIRSVKENAESWQEPVPAGMVVLKPAHGITIVVNRETAKRITVKKSTYDEI